MQLPEQAELESPPMAPKVPLGQGVHVAAPAEEKLPAGHGVALKEAGGQKEPAGQRRGAPPLQKKPGGAEHGAGVGDGEVVGEVVWPEQTLSIKRPKTRRSKIMRAVLSAVVTLRDAAAPRAARNGLRRRSIRLGTREGSPAGNTSAMKL